MIPRNRFAPIRAVSTRMLNDIECFESSLSEREPILICHHHVSLHCRSLTLQPSGELVGGVAASFLRSRGRRAEAVQPSLPGELADSWQRQHHGSISAFSFPYRGTSRGHLRSPRVSKESLGLPKISKDAPAFLENWMAFTVWYVWCSSGCASSSCH